MGLEEYANAAALWPYDWDQIPTSDVVRQVTYWFLLPSEYEEYYYPGLVRLALLEAINGTDFYACYRLVHDGGHVSSRLSVKQLCALRGAFLALRSTYASATWHNYPGSKLFEEKLVRIERLLDKYDAT